MAQLAWTLGPGDTKKKVLGTRYYATFANGKPKMNGSQRVKPSQAVLCSGNEALLTLATIWLLLWRDHEVDIFIWNVLTTIGWISMKLPTDIHGAQRINNIFVNDSKHNCEHGWRLLVLLHFVLVFVFMQNWANRLLVFNKKTLEQCLFFQLFQESKLWISQNVELLPYSLVDATCWAKMMQAITNIHKEKRKATTTKKKKKNYLHVIKQTLTKIYKTFKSFESVKNVHLCHHVKTDNVRTNKCILYRSD